MYNYRMSLIMGETDENEIEAAKQDYLEFRDMDSFSDEDVEDIDECFSDVEEQCQTCEGEGDVALDAFGFIVNSTNEASIAEIINCWDCGGTGYIKI